MTTRRDIRLWDSSVIIAYLGNEPGYRDVLLSLVEEAEKGNLTIVVSSLATVEVAYVGGVANDAAEAIIRDFFANDYIVTATIGPRLAATARRLVRQYGQGLGLRPPDATHLATAITLGIPTIETMDADMLRLDGLEGQPAIRVRQPII